MFTTEINEFTSRLDHLESLLAEINEKVLNSHLDLSRGINEILKTFQSQSVYQQNKMFEACAKGFVQVRDACECLREELSAATGNMIDQSFRD